MIPFTKMDHRHHVFDRRLSTLQFYTTNEYEIKANENKSFACAAVTIFAIKIHTYQISQNIYQVHHKMHTTRRHIISFLVASAAQHL